MLLGVEVARDLDGLVGATRACSEPASSGARDGDRADPELAAGAEDPHRDLAAVRDEELADQLHIRKTPNVVSGIGAFSAAEMPSASTRRVSSGSMMPSSQSRAVE